MAGMKNTVIVVGNEKGGSGKTTTCMHLIATMLYLQKKVGSIDLDHRQLSLTAYINNRKANYPQHPVPQHLAIRQCNVDSLQILKKLQEEEIVCAIETLCQSNEFIIIDTAAGNHPASQIVGAYADIIITPMNDSFVDMQLIMEGNGEVFRPGVYSNLVWQQKIVRAAKTQKGLDWVIIKNRTSHMVSHNTQKINKILQEVSQKLGFRIVPGLSERTIYRELFLQGLTLLDIEHLGMKLTPSHILARQELRSMLQELQIPNLEAEAT